ncbi:MBOAT family O-acyltransferase [Candidatus Omnitrophota bacterium]
MLFNSFEFLCFFIVVYSLYVLLHKQHKWQNKLLLVASYVFYGSWDWRFLSLIVISTIVDYFCGIYIDASDNEKTRKQFLFLSVFCNLSMLGFFKYFNFFITSFCSFLKPLGISQTPGLLNVVLPVGISFYTFQTLSYTIDIYRKQLKPTRRFWDFALFVSFFPQLVAGPIERAKRLLPQILEPRVLSWSQFQEGCFLIFWGLFEKIFIAGSLAKIVDAVFATSAPYEGGAVLVAVYAFAFQIFCDFDAYSNIARGLAKCMGIELMINFNLPYFAVNPREFWQRWHISLSTWLRDYLYIPLGGNARGTLMLYRNLFLTMLLGGLWHGAAWTFVLWGIYQGALLIGHRFIRTYFYPGQEKMPKNAFVMLLKMGIFFQLVCVGWLIFRAQSVSQLGEMLWAVLTQFNFNATLFVNLGKVIMIISPLLVVQVGQYFSGDLMYLLRRHWFVKTFAYAFMTYLILGWGVMTAEEFIYFQF